MRLGVGGAAVGAAAVGVAAAAAAAVVAAVAAAADDAQQRPFSLRHPNKDGCKNAVRRFNVAAIDAIEVGALNAHWACCKLRVVQAMGSKRLTK